MEAAGLSETLVTAHGPTQCHTVEDYNTYFHCRMNLKSHNVKYIMYRKVHN
jgi:hypothetical protein